MEAASGSGERTSLALRLTARGRDLIGDEPSGGVSVARMRPELASELEGRRLTVGSAARVADVLELNAFVDIASVEGGLELDISSVSVARGLAEGISAEEMRTRIEALCELSDELREALDEAGTVVGRATLSGAAGFLWIDEPEVREMLRTMQPVADLFVDPSPPSGLLVAAGVDPERLVRRCRALGVEVKVDEGVMRVRHSTMPPPKKSESRKAVSWRPPPRPKSSARS
jgi:hypothetical protein